MKALVSICGVFLTVLAAGCSGDGLNTVSGTVTFDGQPIQNGTIEFLPADGQGPTAAAVIEDGGYHARVAPGPKEVRIVGYRKTGERHVVPGDPSSPMIDIQEQIVPEKYNSNTQLQCEIVAGGRQDFELKSE